MNRDRFPIFTSRGPAGTIRGTASVIAARYTELARDADRAGDVILAESCRQHAEHYRRSP